MFDEFLFRNLEYTFSCEMRVENTQYLFFSFLMREQKQLLDILQERQIGGSQDILLPKFLNILIQMYVVLALAYDRAVSIVTVFSRDSMAPFLL